MSNKDEEDEVETEVEENKASMVTKVTLRGLNTLGKKKFVNSVKASDNDVKSFIRIKRKGVGSWG